MVELDRFSPVYINIITAFSVSYAPFNKLCCVRDTVLHKTAMRIVEVDMGFFQMR